MKKIKVIIFGLGTVGISLLKIFKKNNFIINGTKIEVVGVNARKKLKKREVDISKFNWIKSVKEIDQHKPDLVFELIGGTGTNIKAIYDRCLKLNINIITANKAFLATYPKYFYEFSKKKLFIGKEASVLGAVPIVRYLENVVTNNKINSLVGIFNGTTNYVLTNMTVKKISFTDSLQQAIKSGFAEADYDADINGSDALHKLIILTYLAFGKIVSLKDVYCEGIQNVDFLDIKYANKFDYEVKLIASIKKEKNNFELFVSPCFVKKSNPLAHVKYEDNSIYIEGENFFYNVIQGKGAGGLPTASSLISDTVAFLKPSNFDISKNENKINFVSNTYKFYLRFKVQNKIGVMKSLSSVFASTKISIESLIQMSEPNQKNVNIVIITDSININLVTKLLKLLDKKSFVKSNITKIKILNE